LRSELPPTTRNDAARRSPRPREHKRPHQPPASIINRGPAGTPGSGGRYCANTQPSHCALTRP